MGFMQSLNLWKKLLMWVVCVPLMPLFCIVYIIAPDCKVPHTVFYRTHVAAENVTLYFKVLNVLSIASRFKNAAQRSVRSRLTAF